MQLKLSEGALGGWKAPVGGNFSVHNFFIFWILNNVGELLIQKSKTKLKWIKQKSLYQMSRSSTHCKLPHCSVWGFPGSSDNKESACNVGDPGDLGVGKIPWSREWQPIPLFLPREYHGQRSLAGYSPVRELQRIAWGLKESDTTERL